MLKNGQSPRKNGGKRTGSGRKPKPITLLKRQMAEDGKAEAEYAFSLLVSIMHDETMSNALRRDCAKDVLDRIMGKPAITMRGDPENPLTVKFEDVRAKLISKLLEESTQAAAGEAAQHVDG